MSELTIKATRGMFWSLAENLGLQATQFVISVILARLLLPEQFGLIGLLTLFIALAQSILDSGFGTALIQKKETNQLDFCSVFYFNLLIGIVLILVLFGTAPIIANFYNQPILAPLTRFLSLGVLFNAFSLVPMAILNKRIDFKALFKVSLISVVISGGVGISLAVNGWGVWSLAVQSVLNTLIRAGVLWITSRWRPSLAFSKASLRSMFGFGSRMMVSGLIDTFFVNIFQPLIGKLYSVADVGYFTRAQTLQAAAVQPTGAALWRVIFPALSPIQNEKERLKNAVQKITKYVVLLHFPLMIGLIVIAYPLVIVLMTERWAPSVLYFQLFCVVGILWPLHVINLNNLTVLGRSDLFLRVEIIKKIMIVAAIAITYRWGITALLLGQVVASIGAYFINCYYSGKLLDYSAWKQIRDFFPFLCMAIVMGSVMYIAGISIQPLFIRGIAQIFTGVLVYAGLNILFSKSILIEIFTLTRSTLKAQVL